MKCTRSPQASSAASPRWAARVFCWAPVGGAAVWQTLENGLNMIGAQVGIQRIVIGVIVVLAVLLDVVFRRGIFSRKTTKKTNELPAGVQK